MEAIAARRRLLQRPMVELYNDSALNALEEQVSVSNQNVLQAEAQYKQAKAAVSVARAALFPIVTTTPSIATGRGTATGNGSGASGRQTSFTLPFNVSWEPDLWETFAAV